MQQCRGKAFSLRSRAMGCQFQVEKELRLMPKICKSNVSSSQCIRASMVSRFEPVQQVPLAALQVVLQDCGGSAAGGNASAGLCGDARTTRRRGAERGAAHRRVKHERAGQPAACGATRIFRRREMRSRWSPPTPGGREAPDVRSSRTPGQGCGVIGCPIRTRTSLLSAPAAFYPGRRV